jgi:hypothetical protein
LVEFGKTLTPSATAKQAGDLFLPNNYWRCVFRQAEIKKDSLTFGWRIAAADRT